LVQLSLHVLSVQDPCLPVLYDSLLSQPSGRGHGNLPCLLFSSLSSVFLVPLTCLCSIQIFPLINGSTPFFIHHVLFLCFTFFGFLEDFSNLFQKLASPPGVSFPSIPSFSSNIDFLSLLSQFVISLITSSCPGLPYTFLSAIFQEIIFPPKALLHVF